LNDAERRKKFLLALKFVNDAQDIVEEIMDDMPCAILYDEWDNLAESLETARADMEHIKKEWRGDP